MTFPVSYGGSGNDKGSDRSKRFDLTTSEVVGSQNIEYPSTKKQRSQASASTNSSRESIPLNGSTDVGAVVAKAKKAAASLYVILHAQRCRLGAYRCTFKGCAEAKIVLLHIKTCPARNGQACPQQYRGCVQTRKLLDHYEQCREIRLRQSRVKPSSRGSPHRQQTPACLVCSLVARQARTLLEGGGCRPATSPGKPKKIISSFTLSKPKVSPAMTSVVVPSNLIRSHSAAAMPPPPPLTRPAQSTQSFGWSSQPRPAQPTQNYDDCALSSSLPSTSELMSHKITAVAAAANPQPIGGEPVNPVMLGRSLDSSNIYMDKMEALLQATRKDIARVKGELASLPKAAGPQRRSRSESYDATAKPLQQLQQQQPPAVVGAAFCQTSFDPTLEFTLRSGRQNASMPNPEERNAMPRRRRSVSAGVVADVAKFATIYEEPSDQPFPMEDGKRG